MKLNPWYYFTRGMLLRQFDKKEFHKWNYRGGSKTITDFFSMYNMGGEL